jgi:hypothetical protein
VNTGRIGEHVNKKSEKKTGDQQQPFWGFERQQQNKKHVDVRYQI